MDQEDALEALRKATGIGSDVWLRSVLHELSLAGVVLVHSTCDLCDEWMVHRCPVHDDVGSG